MQPGREAAVANYVHMSDIFAYALTVVQLLVEARSFCVLARSDCRQLCRCIPGDFRFPVVCHAQWVNVVFNERDVLYRTFQGR